MATSTAPQQRIKCTFSDCDQYFDTIKDMKRHKKYEDEHEYCHKCDEDFDTFEDYVQHKIYKPVEHNKACRICGEEFKSDSGIRKHIEITHKIDQKLVCIGCGDSFHRASLLIEHLEFNHCSVISAQDLEGFVVHKQFILELMAHPENMLRFNQKQSNFVAAQDGERKGGVSLTDEIFQDDRSGEVTFSALKADTPPETPLSPECMGPYPPLPSQASKHGSKASSIISSFSKLSVDDRSVASTAKQEAFPKLGAVASPGTHSVSGKSSTSSSLRPAKAWSGRAGTTAAKALFKDAKATPVPAKSATRVVEDDEIGPDSYLNIMTTRFWDPLSTDYQPERFFDAMVGKYYCPFTCEQSFLLPTDIATHILQTHRHPILRCIRCMKRFSHATALVAHCENGTSRCDIRRCKDYGRILDQISGGFLAVRDAVRPDHSETRTVLVTDPRSGAIDKWTPDVHVFAEYRVTKPMDWKDPVGKVVVGRGSGW